MQVGVLSDTHIVSLARELHFLEALARGPFAGCEVILHAGDMVDPAILDVFADRTVHAVRGNLDPPVPGLPLRKILDLDGWRVGLIHGWGVPAGIEERINREFTGEALDCLVYGHSHQPACHRRGRTLFFNPGSATDRRNAPHHTVGLLTIAGGISGRILVIDDLLAREEG